MRWSTLMACAAVMALSGAHAFAERLPARAYTTADGLGHDRVLCVVQDSRGFLWFCTIDGLSRFDGHRFVNYGEREGLPAVPVYSFIESRPGVYWVGTYGGLARFDATRPSGAVALHRPCRRKSLQPGGRSWPFSGIDPARCGQPAKKGFFGSTTTPTKAAFESSRCRLPVSTGRPSAESVRCWRTTKAVSGWPATTPSCGGRAISVRWSYAMQVAGRLLKARCLLEVEPGTLWIGTSNTVIVLRAEPQRACPRSRRERI